MKAPRFVASSVIAIAVLSAIYAITSSHAHAGRHRAGKDAESTPLSAVESKRAQALYASKCAACHGMDLQGGVGRESRTRLSSSLATSRSPSIFRFLASRLLAKRWAKTPPAKAIKPPSNTPPS